MIKPKLILSIVIFTFISVLISGCKNHIVIGKMTLEEVAESNRLWTGVAVSAEERIFTNYPRWTPIDSFSVVEIKAGAKPVPYPNLYWNQWKTGLPADKHFICVQSVYVDKQEYLWILDTGLDIQRGLIPSGTKLIKIDLSVDEIIQKIVFDKEVLPAGCYLNDVRIDTDLNYAYITDSGLGAIIVTDLSTGKSHRILSEHPSTKSENIVLSIDGKEWLHPNGQKPQIHSDGIALDATGEYLYYQALTGRTMYRIKTKHLRDTSLSAIDLGNKIETVGTTGASDGIVFDSKGILYLTSIEMNSIRRLTKSGKVETVIQDTRLKWPDSFSISKGGYIYMTTSQLHLNFAVQEPYKIFRFKTE